ncbi:MAG: hypothetical protein IJ315_04245 [Firmicutes bacterium]|nr:hypothetical protein [Bacillota bacterium]
MSKPNSVNSLYANSQRIDAWCQYLFWANCIFALITTFTGGVVKEVLLSVQIIGALLYVALSSIDDGLFWYNAEMARRKNNIQNAYRVQLSELETEECYNNTIEPSLLKYATNTFESNFYSKFIAGKMLSKSALMALLAIVGLVVSGWVVSNGEALVTITQAVFSAYVIEDTIMLTVYKIRMDHLYDEAFLQFVTSSIKDEKQEAWMLSYVVEYEVIKAHYKVRLDSKIFSTYGQELKEQWSVIEGKMHKN